MDLGIATIVGAAILSLANLLAAWYAKQKSESKRVKVWLSLGIFFLLMAIVIYFVWRQEHINVEITDPVNGSQVDRTATVRGRWKNVPDGQFIWIAVYSHPAKLYYPHEATPYEDGSWESLDTELGSSIDSKQEFDIIAILVSETAQEGLKRQISRPEYRGLSQLPDEGLKRYDLIGVRRK